MCRTWACWCRRCPWASSAPVSPFSRYVTCVLFPLLLCCVSSVVSMYVFVCLPYVSFVGLDLFCVILLLVVCFYLFLYSLFIYPWFTLFMFDWNYIILILMIVIIDMVIHSCFSERSCPRRWPSTTPRPWPAACCRSSTTSRRCSCRSANSSTPAALASYATSSAWRDRKKRRCRRICCGWWWMKRCEVNTLITRRVGWLRMCWICRIEKSPGLCSRGNVVCLLIGYCVFVCVCMCCMSILSISIYRVHFVCFLLLLLLCCSTVCCIMTSSNLMTWCTSNGLM